MAGKTLEVAPTRWVRPGVRALFAKWAVAGIGLALVVATGLYWLRYEITAFDATIVALPGAATIAAWFLVRRGGIAATDYGYVLRTTLVGGVGLGGFIVAVLVVQGGSLVDAVPLLLFLAATGTTAGVLVGATRVHGLRAERQAEALRVERKRLHFLNHLLRHNVLNKVAIVKGNATLAAEESGVEDAYIDPIIDHSDDIVQLVENVRVLVTAAARACETHPVDCSSALRREIDSITDAHDDVDLSADVPDGVTVLADELLRYVFENVLHNAVVHNTGPEPSVTVTVTESAGSVHVRVADDGPGIPDDEKDLLFAPEMHGDHGAGLYLVHTLVSQYGGEVEVADNDPQGTVVTVSLRRAD